MPIVSSGTSSARSRLFRIGLLGSALTLSLDATTTFAQRGPGRQPIVLSEGPLPDITAIREDGEPIKVRELIDGKFTVLKTGCLTCPEFFRAYGEIEAAAIDYADKEVQFYYVMQSLRHPEREGYVQAQNTGERLMHLAEAKAKLATRVPWIADTIDDSFRVAMRTNSNSVFLISPTGEIVYAADRMNGDGLHRALARFVGPVEMPTSVRQLDLPRLPRTRHVNTESDVRVKRPEGLVILATTPDKPEETYYVKLRAEAEPKLLETGKGRLFLGFYPDPIHGAKWNNLAPPMKYELTLPEGASATPAVAEAHRGTGDSDTEPRQFWVDFVAKEDGGEVAVTLHYYACTETLCEAMSHRYTITLEPEDKNSRTFGFNRGRRGRPGGGDRPRRGQRPASRMSFD